MTDDRWNDVRIRESWLRLIQIMMNDDEIEYNNMMKKRSNYIQNMYNRLLYHLFIQIMKYLVSLIIYLSILNTN